MANRIEYGEYTFNDDAIFSGKMAMQSAMMMDTLVPDELSVEVMSNATGNNKVYTVLDEWYHTKGGRGYVVGNSDIRNFTYGTPVYYYFSNANNTRLMGKFYIRSVERLSVDRFQLNAISAVGIWSTKQHMGGLYSGQLAGTVIADILDGYTYTIDSKVSAEKIYGWLPVASVRDNLQQVLFALGASLIKNNTTGEPHIQFLSNPVTYNIPGDRIFLGSSYTYKSPATEIVVTEHGFYESGYDIEVSLFDNTDGTGAVDHLLVTFDKPCHNLQAYGSLTINESGVNYAIVTGTGYLVGNEYTHTQKVFSVPTDATGDPRIVTVKDATLVSLANSVNVAARVADYETKAEEVSLGMTLSANDLMRTGVKLNFTDPYGESIQGLLSKMDLTMSGTPKADCVAIKNYAPAYFGNNFRRSVVISTNQTWTPPAGTTLIRVVIGQGGQAGSNGTKGENAVTIIDPISGEAQSAVGGEGGSGGVAGSPGKVFSVDLENPTALTIVIGAAGTASNTEGGTGGTGGHSTVTMGGTTYTSNSGEVPEAGFLNIFTGIKYANPGIDGLNGGNGGGFNDGPSEDPVPAGNVTYKTSTWTGGAKGTDLENEYGYHAYEEFGGGGHGGGAAYGANGSAGQSGHLGSVSDPDQEGAHARAGKGGNGANASIMAYTPTFGSGGAGGCGGGGGGAGGYERYWNGSGYSIGFATSGTGGSYSKGTSGGKGFVIIYY